MTDWVKLLKEYEAELWVILSTLCASYILSTWIQNHYYLLEFFCLILIFGLFNEGYSSLDPDNDLKDFVESIAKSQTGKQIALIWFVGAAVLLSLWIRDIVESQLGALSVVQLLGFIVVLSRLWVNLYTEKQDFRINDGKPDTYTAYSAGILAIILSWIIRDSYPVYTLEHNLLVIWPSLLIPYVLFYHLDIGDMVRELEKKSKH